MQKYTIIRHQNWRTKLKEFGLDSGVVSLIEQHDKPHLILSALKKKFMRMMDSRLQRGVSFTLTFNYFCSEMLRDNNYLRYGTKSNLGIDALQWCRDDHSKGYADDNCKLDTMKNNLDEKSHRTAQQQAAAVRDTAKQKREERATWPKEKQEEWAQQRSEYSKQAWETKKANGWTFSEETRKEMGNTRRGRPRTEETKRKTSESLKAMYAAGWRKDNISSK